MVLSIAYVDLDLENKALKEEVEALRCMYIKNYKKKIERDKSIAEELSLENTVEKFKEKRDENSTFYSNGFCW